MLLPTMDKDWRTDHQRDIILSRSPNFPFTSITNISAIKTNLNAEFWNIDLINNFVELLNLNIK